MPAFKRHLLLPFVFLLFSFILTPLVFGKTALENARDDYTFQFTKYQEAKTNYLQDKAAYEKFKTAISKNEAFVSTKDYLLQVSKLYSSYLLLVKERGNQINWAGKENQRDKTLKLIDEDIAYLSDYTNRTKSAQTLEELTALSVDLSTQNKNKTLPKLYKVLSLYEVTETKSTLNYLNTTSQDVETYLSNNPSQNQSVIANWKTEIANIKNTTNSFIEKSEQILAKTGEDTAKYNEFEEISQRTNSAKSTMKRSQNLFQEILRLL